MDSTILETDELFALLKLDIENDRYEAALIKIKQVLAGENIPKEAHLIAARLYAKLGLYPRSQEQYTVYVDAEPNTIIGKFELGMTFFDSNDIDDAINNWNKVLEQNSNYPPALFYKSLAYARIGDINSAKSNLQTLMKSVAAENLYFQKGRELSSVLDSNKDIGGFINQPLDAYSGENENSDTTKLPIQ